MPASVEPATHRIRVTVNGREYSYTGPFSVGRGKECQLCIPDEYVSRKHVEVALEEGRWRVCDTGSANGLFVNGKRVSAVDVTGPVTVRLGVGGPFVTLEANAPEPQPADGQQTIIARVTERYFGAGDGHTPPGERTVMIRRAFELVQQKQRRQFTWVVAVLGLALLGLAGAAWYNYSRAAKQTAVAEEIFYSMKAIDVQMEKLVAASGVPAAQEYRERRKSLENDYERFLSTLGVYDPKMPEEDRLILRVARIFGECELAMPPDFRREVQKYIKAWQSTGKYRKAIALARQNGYNTWIARELLRSNVSPHFFYLALQESEFEEYISGPPTRKGFAKGMWQFIPETAVRYGLRVGPLAGFPRPDPADDRHNWKKSTDAAARYIRDIYATDAQASGLLVMASYNWGEDRVIDLIRKMPANPRERNFWKLMSAYGDKVPAETYNYVFSIFSAAVIGENPRLFGFDFDNPVAQVQLR